MQVRKIKLVITPHDIDSWVFMVRKDGVKFVFITGGVVSSLGKGIAAAALASMLQERGYKVQIKKLDPYLNIDPGTMNPLQHGEVYITEDGAEADLDLGHYERIGGVATSKLSSITSGRVYQELLSRERRGDYLGLTVQIVPHTTNLILEFIQNKTEEADIVICEIGGTAGDMEGAPFLEAARQMKRIYFGRVSFVHVTLLPYISASQELKTKPTQHSVKILMAAGIEPDVLLCRTERPIPILEVKKLSTFCNVEEDCVIEAIDLKNIYEAPIAYAKNGFDIAVLKALGITERPLRTTKWEGFLSKMSNIKREVKIAIVGKYSKSSDSYKSLIEALIHAGCEVGIKPKIILIPAGEVNDSTAEKLLNEIGAIIVPGGFGIDQTDGKVAAIKYARTKNIPFLGICFGMQLAVIEFCKNVLGIKNATSSEFVKDDVKDHTIVIDIMEGWTDLNGKVQYRKKEENLGGTLHLGAYNIILVKDSLASKLYNKPIISERHRHRYQVVMHFKSQIEGVGGLFSAFSENEELPEIFEIPKCKFFIGCQFHPEFKSTPFAPHPIFVGLLRAINH